MMPGLTVNTDLAKGQSSVSQTLTGLARQGEQPDVSPGTATDGSNVGSQPTAQASQNVQPHSTATTTPPPRRSESPERPPMSPITPPLRATELPQRPEYTHLNQLPQTSTQPPPPEPIDFASNPDVLALQSAIAILQMQKKKAAADMVALSKAKEAALANPQEFLGDLGNGRVGYEGDRLFPTGNTEKSDSESSDDEPDNEEGGAKTHRKSTRAKSSTRQSAGQTQPWNKLPKPQNVVRMPPINWSQYAVVGESLDRIHQEQLTAPSQGAPATMRADGTFHFTAGGNGDAGIFNKQEKLVGVAAPYNPQKDKLAPKTNTSQQQAPAQQNQQTAPAAAKR